MKADERPSPSVDLDVFAERRRRVNAIEEITEVGCVEVAVLAEQDDEATAALEQARVTFNRAVASKALTAQVLNCAKDGISAAVAIHTRALRASADPRIVKLRRSLQAKRDVPYRTYAITRRDAVTQGPRMFNNAAGIAALKSAYTQALAACDELSLKAIIDVSGALQAIEASIDVDVIKEMRDTDGNLDPGPPRSDREPDATVITSNLAPPTSSTDSGLADA